MNIRTFLFLFFVSQILFVRCKKDEQTIPVSLDLNLSVTPADYFFCDNGHILFQQISLEGKRETGDNIFFYTNPSEEIGPITFSSEKLRQNITQFDIPVGIYDPIIWEFSLSDLSDIYDFEEIDSDSREEEDQEDVEMEDIFDDCGILLKGNYLDPNNQQSPMIIAIDEDEIIRIYTQKQDGFDRITLSAGGEYSATLFFNLQYALGIIDEEFMTEAEKTFVSDNSYILIHPDHNESMYESILNRLQKSLKLIIE